MRRGLSVAALVLGGIGMLPLLPVLLSRMPFYRHLPKFIFYHISQHTAVMAFAILIAPCLLLAGLINIQPTDRRRWMVIIWAMSVCVVTAPFGIGMLLCLPVLICTILPIMRAFRSSETEDATGRGTAPPVPEGLGK